MTLDEEKTLSLGVGLSKKSAKSLKVPLFFVADKLKKAFSDITELRGGLKLVYNDYLAKKSRSIDFSVSAPPLEFAFCVSGSASVEIREKSGEKKSFLFEKGMSAVFFLPKAKGTITIRPGRLKIVSLHVAPAFLKEFVDDDFSGLPRELAEIAAERGDFFLRVGQSPPSALAAAKQAADALAKSPKNKLFLEGKALEAMAAQISEMIEEGNSAALFELKPSDVEAVKKIREFIEANCWEKFSLEELALKAGMSRAKFAYVHRKLFFSSVFEFVRAARLEKARIALLEGELSVSQIAYEYGFSSPSHFAREFSKKFGVSPKKYAKNAKISPAP